MIECIRRRQTKTECTETVCCCSVDTLASSYILSRLMLQVVIITDNFLQLNILKIGHYLVYFGPWLISSGFTGEISPIFSCDVSL